MLDADDARAPPAPAPGADDSPAGEARPAARPDDSHVIPGIRWLLVLLTAIGPAAFQIFLPALPSIQRDFGVAAGTAQLALSLSMLGIAVATLAYGGLSDRYGRRPVLIVGMALLVAGSAICAFAPGIAGLIVGRIVQAAGAASGMVVTRAIVMDMYGRERSGAVMAQLLAAMILAPMLATPLGGFLTDNFGWRVNFATIGVVSVATLAAVLWKLPETRRQVAHSAGYLADWGRLMRSRDFNGFAWQGAFVMAAFTVFNTGSPYFFGNGLGISATGLGFAFLGVGLGFAAGSLSAMRLPASIDLRRRVRVGSVVALAAAGLALTLAALGDWSVWTLLIPSAGFAFATGITMPAAQAGAIGAVRDLAGTASGLSGFLGTLLAAACTQAVGVLSDGSPWPVAIAMTALAALSLAAAATIRRERSGG